jgi:hypothetical protein
MSWVTGKHHVVVAAPLHAEALERLRALFSVELKPCVAEAAHVASASGLVLCQNAPFPAALLPRLPRLQAIGLTGAGAGRVDLPALTKAGIRVTHAPLDDEALIEGALWRLLERALNEVALNLERPPGAAGSENASILTRARPSLSALLRPRPALSNAAARVLRFAGSDPLTQALAVRARDAGYRCLPDPPNQVPGDSSARVDSADIVVLVSDDHPQSPGIPADTPVVDLRAEREVRSRPAVVAALRDQLAVDGLIASMGIGRDGFHPRFLLNPEVCPMSCC